MRKMFLLLSLMFVLSFFVGLSVVGAQDITISPDTGVIDSSGNMVLVNLPIAIGGMIAIFVTGVGSGMAGLLMLVSRLKNDQVTLRAIEGLITSAPPDLVKSLQDISKLLIESGTVLNIVSDGQPNPTVQALSASYQEAPFPPEYPPQEGLVG